MSEPSDKKIVKAVIVGSLMIVSVFAITLLRPYLVKKSAGLPAQSEKSVEQLKLIESQRISAEELQKKIAAKEKIAIIDIRTAAEFEREHIFGSQNIAATDLVTSAGSLANEKTYVLIDNGSAPEAANIISSSFLPRGYSNIFFLSGGISAWRQILGSTISAGDAGSFIDNSKVSRVSIDQLKESLAKKESLTIIDLRKENHYNEGHLPGAINIFLDDLETKKESIPIGKKIILYDNDGAWAFRGAVRLFDMGFFNVFALDKGLDEWKKLKLEIQK